MPTAGLKSNEPPAGAKNPTGLNAAALRADGDAASAAEAGSGKRGGLTRYLPIAGLLVVFALASALGLHRYLSLDAFLDSRQALKAWVEAHWVLAGLGFILLYAGLVAVAFPAASLVTVASGFLFGWFIGGALTVIGATLGATVLFIAARTAFGDILRKKTGGAVARFAEGFRDDAFAYLIVLRLTPALPFFVVNVAPAFFDVSVSTYVITTFLGIIPGSMVYAFLGSGLDQALVNAGEGAFSIADLVTPEMTIAFVGLAGLAILGVLLKKTVLRKRAA
ncbi:TVP38/TMEM64 family protein [Jiella sp. MQZ9-1]|uniref:TVP38/TMEM64 family membrane protein n=1 Tax=Jiella flava TaxID=2816857 RepID=A0A939FXR2_9HYPH|nr:TVP38/TMEM64 family protein [Jiella flava]MBO0662095.1 TVP38/TMEM64 family protein [Jiella flava]MCD2470577.1 TVP38/TMEM64 family protein [Jiella flava]